MHKLCVVTYEKEKKIQLHTVLQGNKKETNIRKKTNTWISQETNTAETGEIMHFLFKRRLIMM